MSFRNKIVNLMGLLCMITLMSSAHAELVTIDKALHSSDQTQRVQATTREGVQQELIKLGVDPDLAKERVNRMTDAEVAEINGRLEELPAGAGISTVDLLLIIIIILLI